MRAIFVEICFVAVLPYASIHKTVIPMFFRDSPLALEQSDCEISLASIDTFISNIPKKKQTANTVHNFCDVLLSC